MYCSLLLAPMENNSSNWRLRVLGTATRCPVVPLLLYVAVGRMETACPFASVSCSTSVTADRRNQIDAITKQNRAWMFMFCVRFQSTLWHTQAKHSLKKGVVDKMNAAAFLLTCVLTVCCRVSAFVAPLQARASHLSSCRAGGTASCSRKRRDGIRMEYVAMNRFKVKLGCEDEFEKVWRERESKLQNFSGFEKFMLLKVDTGDEGGEEGGATANLGHTEFVSHTTWKHKLDFEEWRQSQAFKKSHVQSKIGDMVLGRPEASVYDAVIIEPVPPEHQGGLWEFENEASYFDGDM